MAYCQECGSSLEKRNQSDVTGPLVIMIYLLWIIIAIMGLYLVVTLLISFKLNLIVLFTGFFFVFAARGLPKYDNSARTVLLLVIFILLLFDLTGLIDDSGTTPFLILMNFFTLYTLAFHRPTLELFHIH